MPLSSWDQERGGSRRGLLPVSPSMAAGLGGSVLLFGMPGRHAHQRQSGWGDYWLKTVWGNKKQPESEPQFFSDSSSKAFIWPIRKIKNLISRCSPALPGDKGPIATQERLYCLFITAGCAGVVSATLVDTSSPLHIAKAPPCSCKAQTNCPDQSSKVTLGNPGRILLPCDLALLDTRSKAVLWKNRSAGPFVRQRPGHQVIVWR